MSHPDRGCGLQAQVAKGRFKSCLADHGVLKQPRSQHTLGKITWETVSAGIAVSLEYLIRDYHGHLREHLKNIGKRYRIVSPSRMSCWKSDVPSGRPAPRCTTTPKSSRSSSALPGELIAARGFERMGRSRQVKLEALGRRSHSGNLLLLSSGCTTLIELGHYPPTML